MIGFAGYRHGRRIPIDPLDGTAKERFIGHFPRGLDVYLPLEAQVMERRALAEELRGARDREAKLAAALEKERELRRRAPRGSQNAGTNAGGKDRPMTKSMSRAFKTLRY